MPASSAAEPTGSTVPGPKPARRRARPSRANSSAAVDPLSASISPPVLNRGADQPASLANAATAREVTASFASMEDVGRHHGREVTLRDLLVHLVEEYARHAGHADLLRECIDGRVGQ